MALFHLKYKGYKEVYDKYLDVLNFQNVLNQKGKDLLDLNIKHFKDILQVTVKDEPRLDALLEYYLLKIDSIEQWIDNQESVQYQLSHFDPISDLSGQMYSNPFPEKVQILKNDIMSRYVEIIKVTNEFNKNLISFIEKITTFKNSLRPIIDNGVLGIKGKCFIEEQLSLKGRIKSFLRPSK